MKPRNHASFDFAESPSSNKGSKSTRPLGSVRYANFYDQVPRFPPLQGITGNAMQVPPAKVAQERVSIEVRESQEVTEREPNRRNPRSVVSSKSDSSSSTSDKKRTDSADKKELNEAMARERQLKQQVMSLQKVIDELRAQLREKEKVISDLQQQFERQEEQYKEQIQKEVSRHEETQLKLDTATTDLAAQLSLIEELKRLHAAELQALREQMEQKLKDLATEKDKEIASRDEKLTKLKNQMAEALKGNSWERQQQLDELTKELGRVQEEADMLRLKLKQVAKNGNKNGPCSNCDSIGVHLEKAKKGLAERDKMIKELKMLCSKFEKQLTQQDELLKQYSSQRKIKVP